ncbi:MAG: cation transporter [Oscillospiraceae bacterium]|nr:cation transporter [Oscillospiraceae bacterium]
MTKTIAEIEGMSCGMCEAHINDVIRRSFDIKSVKPSHKQNKTEIISVTPVDEEKLRKVIADIGYQVISVQSEEYMKKGLFGK